MKHIIPKKKLHSKRGMTLIEILIGVTIVVIVFASTLGAMVGGFTTTVNNADENRAAVMSASLNEIILNTLHNIEVNDKSDFDDIADAITESPDQSQILAAVSATMPTAYYVKAVDDGTGKMTVNFLDYDAPEASASPTARVQDKSFQYSLIPETTTNLKVSDVGANNTVEIKGITIKTCFQSAGGPIIYESFVPYNA